MSTVIETDLRERTRALLHHMLTVRTEQGLPVVSTSLVLLEIAEDVNDNWHRHVTPEILLHWAYGREMSNDDATEAYSAGGYISADVDFRYRVMVGAMQPTYPIYWLCAPPSTRWGDARFPAYDRRGKRIV